MESSTARENILSKIKNGLEKAKLPKPFQEVEYERIEEVYSVSELSPEELFASEFIRLGGKFVFCENEQEFIDGIHNLFDARGWKEILCAENDLLQHFQNNKLPFISPANSQNSTADACITGCEALIARTGSVLISSKLNLGRTAPVFYPVHIIVAYSNQIVRDIKEGFDFLNKKYGVELPSMINLNTGPSRTADIEKTLVVGVHGPGEVFCFYIGT